jgi:quercetin dioxygenase-like cupin family protein
MTTVHREHLLTGDLTDRPEPIDRVETHRVTMPPGVASGPHTHAGGVTGYVTSGRIMYELDGHPAQELHPGSAFFEPPGATIRRFDNLSTTEPATFVACYLLTGDQQLIESLERTT